MLSYLSTSILESDAQTVVNTVNTVGVMGKGLAAELKRRYPEMFKRYRDLCREGKFKVGQLWLWKGPDQWVLSFPTKEDWRQPSRISYIEAGLEKFVRTFEERGITEIAFPRLGCGNGGLDWEDVRPVMERYLADLPIRIDVHDYDRDIGLPEHKEIASTDFKRSFESFLAHLRGLLEDRSGQFHAIPTGSPFRASFDGASELRIERGQDGASDAGISQDELYEVWLLLQRGPVTADSLSGRAREEAEFLLPLLSTLPFVRSLEVRHRSKPGQLGVELVDRRNPPSLAPGAAPQPALPWPSPHR